MATTQQSTDDVQPAAEKRAEAEQIEELADRLRDADSIADEVPVFAELFIKARTSQRNPRDGRFVAQLSHDDVDGWESRSVAFLGNGTRYGQTPADVIVSHKPTPFLTVEAFSRRVADQLDEKAQAARKTAEQIEYDQRCISVPDSAGWY